MAAPVHRTGELEREGPGGARELREGGVERRAQLGVGGVGVGRLEARGDAVDRAGEHALVDRERDALGLRAVPGGDHGDLAAAHARGGREGERRLVDQRVHRVVRVEVGIEDQVGLVAGLDDERDGGGREAVIGRQGLGRAGGLGGDARLDRRAQALPHRLGAEPRAQAGVGHVHRGDRARDGGPGGGQRRGRLGVVPGGADGQRLRRGEVREQPLGRHDLVDAHALLGAEGDLGVLLGAELPRGVERRRDEHERDDDELARQAQAIERRDGRAQEQGRQGTEDHAKVFGRRPAFLERLRRPA
jgi:hypothetical protein